MASEKYLSFYNRIVSRYENGAKGQLIGLVVQTVAWCNGEWVGFSLGLSMKHLIKDVLGLDSTMDYIPLNKLLQNQPASAINIGM